MSPAELRVLAASQIFAADLSLYTMFESLSEAVRRDRLQRAVRLADELIAVASEPLKPPEVTP